MRTDHTIKAAAAVTSDLPHVRGLDEAVFGGFIRLSIISLRLRIVCGQTARSGVLLATRHAACAPGNFHAPFTISRAVMT